MVSANSTLRGIFVEIKWQMANGNTDGRFRDSHPTMGLQSHCFDNSSSCCFFFSHRQVLLFMRAVRTSGFFEHCFNNTKCGVVSCIMAKGLSVPSVGSLY